MCEQEPLVIDSELCVNNELQRRRAKLSLLRNHSFKFPNDFRCNITFDRLHHEYDEKDNEELKELNLEVSVAGRIMNHRIFGKVSFITLQDISGRIQLYIVYDNLIKGTYNEHFKKWDIGDILGARGKLFKTKTGELSIYCTELYLLTKALRPLPNKYHGLVDQEIRYRQRYLDLISNDKSRQVFKMRSRIIAGIRQFMANYDFLEVETPMMQLIPGGATARPFVTHHNTLNIDMYLRIAPELYLKRLIVGGFNRIFEMNRNFRNEGISSRHNPEFTMMEIYMAYADYNDMIKLIENLLYDLSKNILNNNKIIYNKYVFDFSKPFKKLTMREAIKKYLPATNSIDLNNFDKVVKIAHSLHIDINEKWGVGRVLTEIFSKTVESHLIQPTFITEYPVEVSPLARCNDNNPEITDRFEFFIGGYEIANGFSELNDAEEQKKRLKYQLNNTKEIVDNETMFYDKDYITALEHGLPPTAGVGIGIDRLIMLFTNSNNIRDVILFPISRANCN